MNHANEDATLPGATGKGDEATVQAPGSGKVENQATGHYRLIQKVGEGGMGEVWEAEQLAPIRRRVAYKVIRRGMDSEEVVARFETERQAVALMDHACIAKVFDAGVTSGGRPFFVMEFVPGLPLDEHCLKYRLTTRQRLDLFIKVCEGVQHAHHKAIIHRDLKPSNVLVVLQDNEATPKIIDFGVAKATAQSLTDKVMHTEMGQLLGTPEYMSPEQAEMSQENIDTRTDVYSLGVILYALLAGALPFDAKELRRQSFDEIRRRIREDEPPRPSTQLTLQGENSQAHASGCNTDLTSLRSVLMGDLDWIVMKAIEKDRTRRYGSPAELAADIRRYLADEPVLATPPSALYTMKKFVRRHRYGVATAATLLVLLMGFAVTMTIQAGRIARERDRANLEAETARRVSEVMESLFTQSDPTTARGDTVTAREILDRGAFRIHTELSDQPRVQARLLNIMGKVYRSLGLYGQAQPLLEEALAIQERDLGPEAAEVGKVVQDLGNLLRNTGSYDEAEEMLQRALAIREATLGPDHPKFASSLSDLASLRLAMGRPQEARSLLERSLAIREKALGPDHSEVATSLNNLAIIARRAGENREALQMYRRALDILKKQFGADHPDVANVLNNMANIQKRMGEMDRARRSYEESLAIREKVLGPDHPHVASSLNNLAILLQQEGDLPAARRLHQRALDIREKVLGPDHPDVAMSLQNLAVVMAQTGDYSMALSFHEQALSINELAFGPDHPKVARSHYNLACVLAPQGNKAAALKHLHLAQDKGFINPDMGIDPDLASLRGDPEFEALVAGQERSG